MVKTSQKYYGEISNAKAISHGFLAIWYAAGLIALPFTYAGNWIEPTWRIRPVLLNNIQKWEARIPQVTYR